jgi:deoxyribose-phosphate aldolase
VADVTEATTGADAVLAALPRHIDISCVQAEHTRDDLVALAATARAHGFVAAHVLPNRVPEMRELLDGSQTLTGSPVGFPSGGATTRAKVAEALELLDLGAQELDVVAPIGRIRSGELDYARRELAAVVEAVDGRVPLRAILEVGRLDDDQLRAAVDVAIEAVVPWIKTGTGWSGIPTSVHHIALIAERAGGRARLKAAGGVRDLPTITRMAELGVVRFGMNATAAIAAIEAASASASEGAR